MDKRTLWILLAGVTLAVMLPAAGPVSWRARAAKKDRSAVGLAGKRAGSINEAAADKNTDDPDLPAFLNGKIDKEQYLQMRERYLNRLRGVPYDLPYDPRVRAIHEMERQEASFRQQTSRGPEKFQAVPELTSTSWTAIGPAPIPNGQTVGVLNPVSGRVTAIAVNPVNPNIAYVGAAQGGVYRTLDGGATWTAIFDRALTLSIGAIAISPLNPTTVFVGTGERNISGDSFFGVGVYIIHNATTTADLSGPFNLDLNGRDVLSGNSISKIAVSPVDDNVIYVGTGAGIGGIGAVAMPNRQPVGLYRSTNALGADPRFTLMAVPTNTTLNPSIGDVVFEPGNPNNLLCTVNAIARTTDSGGGVWRTTNALDVIPAFIRVLTLGTPNSLPRPFRVALAINTIGNTVTVLAAADEDAVASGCPISQRGTVRVSTDGGVTWSAPLASAGGFCGGQCYYDIVVAVDPTLPNRIYLGGPADGTCSSAFKRSTDGTTFQIQSQGLHADTHAIAIAPSNPSIIYTGNDGGIFKSTDGGDTWVSLNNSGFNATQFQSLALHPVDPNFLFGGTQDNGTEIFGSDRNWTNGDFGDGGFAVMDQNSPDTSDMVLYHTYFNVIGSLVGFARAMSLSSAVPNGWKFFGCQSDGVSSNGINCDDTNVEFYAPMAVGPGSPSPIYFGTDRLYRSSKLGKRMKLFSQGPIVAGVALSSIGIAPTDDNVRLVGLDDGEVFAATDGSRTLTDVTSDGFPQRTSSRSVYVSRTVVDPKDSNTAYVTFSAFGDPAGQHVWKTTNLRGGASTWVPAGNGIPDVPVNAFAIDPANSLNLYAGTDIGVYRSTDGGSTWVPFSEGLPRVAVFDLAIQPRTGVIRIATHGRGIWERARP